MAEEKQELTLEQKQKLEEYIQAQKEIEEKIERVGKEVNDILTKEGLMLVTDHIIKLIPKTIRR